MRPAIAAVAAVVLALMLAGGPAGAGAATARAEGGEEAFRVLVFSKTGGFRHASIPVGIAAIQRLGSEHGFGVDATEDPAAFTSENLRRYAAVIFLSTTGTVLEAPQKAAFEGYVQNGGGYVGIHSAADTEYQWPFYASVVGAYFKSHPIQQAGDIVREDPGHPATAHLPARLEIFDEFYSFRSNPRQNTHVLLTIDEESYHPDPNTTDVDGAPQTGFMGDHPMSWCHSVGRGRSFYTALGHEAHLYAEDWYQRHLLGGIRTAAGNAAADCRTPAQGAGGAPELRLTRRCIDGGRLRMRLVGDVAAVRHVNFKLDRRHVSRESAAPFEAVLGRRTLRRTRAKRLRAVAYLRTGGGARVILGRTLPRCGAG